MTPLCPHELVSLSRKMVGSLTRHCNLSSRIDVEDIIQDVFLSMWMERERFDADRSRLSVRVFFRAKSRVANAFRDEARRSDRHVIDDPSDIPSRGDDPLEALLRREEMESVTRLMLEACKVLDEEASEIQRAALACDLMDVTQDDVGHSIGRHPSNVCRARRKILGRLRSRLAA
jgi:RNA polymerase sigma factor (sigma-70 family)